MGWTVRTQLCMLGSVQREAISSRIKNNYRSNDVTTFSRCKMCLPNRCQLHFFYRSRKLLVNNWVCSYCQLLVFGHTQPSLAKALTKCLQQPRRTNGGCSAPYTYIFGDRTRLVPLQPPSLLTHSLHTPSSSLFWAGEPQNQHIALTDWMKAHRCCTCSALLCSLCFYSLPEQNAWSNNWYLHCAHCSWKLWLGRYLVTSLPDVRDQILRSCKSIFISQLNSLT